jgi:Arc/MetJ-type ribon-helix-helix transcriptional regulator
MRPIRPSQTDPKTNLTPGGRQVCGGQELRSPPQAYTPTLNLALAPQTEHRIQRELDRGIYREPAEIIAPALDLLDEDQSWPDDEKSELDQRLDRSMAQIERGEGIPGDKLRELLAQRLTLRAG